MFTPTSFGKYFLTEKLATGGMGEIYLAKLIGPGGFEKSLVIKQIHRELGSRRQFVDMFVTEAKTMVSLSHGNIVPIYELGVVDGTYFIAMEYVDGPTLAELQRAARGRGEPLAPPIAAFVCAEILKGLDYAHRKGSGVVHRDLSPRNVIVSRDGEVKILDFGLAATLETAAEASAATSGGGRPVGSFPYMSPEQTRREPLDPRSDLFTVGILLWECLTGEALFARDDDDATLAAVREAPIPPPSRRAAGVPAALDEICLRALQRDAPARWPSAADFLGALSRYLYTVEPAVTAREVSALVARLCPPRPRRPSAPSAETLTPPPPGEATRPQDDGYATRPMSRRPGSLAEERSFATHVEWERILEHTRAPTGSEERALAAPTTTSGRAVKGEAGAVVPSPAVRPRPLLAVAGLLVLSGLASVGLLRARVGTDSRPVPPSAVSPATSVAPAASAGPPTTPLPPADPEPGRADGLPRSLWLPHPDAGSPAAVAATPPELPSKRPAGKARLIVGLSGVPWATLHLDGRKLGTAPYSGTVPAGRHRLRVLCDPSVCPPAGRAQELTLDLPDGAEVKKLIRF